MIRVRPIEHNDRPWVARRLEDAFGEVNVVRKGSLIDASVLLGFVATEGGRSVGLLLIRRRAGELDGDLVQGRIRRDRPPARR
jgi:hypothetical protein